MPVEQSEDPVIVDARGLKCPLPVLLMRRALTRAAAGTSLIVHADDPLAQVDIPVACAQAGGRLVEQAHEGAVLVFRILKAPPTENSQAP